MAFSHKNSTYDKLGMVCNNLVENQLVHVGMECIRHEYNCIGNVVRNLLDWVNCLRMESDGNQDRFLVDSQYSVEQLVVVCKFELSVHELLYWDTMVDNTSELRRKRTFERIDSLVDFLDFEEETIFFLLFIHMFWFDIAIIKFNALNSKNNLDTIMFGSQGNFI